MPKHVPCAVVAVLTVILSCAPAPQPNRAELFEHRLHPHPSMDVAQLFVYDEAALDLAARMAHYKVPGLSIALIDDNRIDWSRAYGIRRAGDTQAVTTGTLFELGSTSKLATAVLTMKLVELGLLELDTPVNEQLRQWKIPNNELSAQNPVTLRMLLSHSAGLNRPDSMYAFEDGSSPTLLDVLNGQAPAINDAVAVESVPGSTHRYSNIAYNVIQLMIEEALGQSFPEAMKERVFTPLGMSSCTYEFPFSEELATHVAAPHDAHMKPGANDLHPSALAHGGLLCSATDLAKLGLDLMKSAHDGSGILLSGATAELMLSPQVTPQDDIGGLNGQGLGAFLLYDENQRYFAHQGYNTPGTCCLLFANPASGDGVALMANGAQGFPLFFEILAGLADVYQWPPITVSP